MNNCPTCGQPWPAKAKRICSDCHLPIKRNERWGFGHDSRPRHKSCVEFAEMSPTQTPTPTPNLFPKD